MKSVKRFPRSISCPSETFKLMKNKNDSDKNINRNIKLNNSFNDSKSLKDNKYSSNQISSLNNSISKGSMEQPEIENFSIEFFLPNFLKEDSEEINEENNLNKDHSYNFELNNQKDINFKGFNNYFINDISTKKEKELPKDIQNFSMNSEEPYEEKSYNSYKNVKNLSISNKEYVNASNNISIPPQNINCINIKMNHNNEIFNNKIDLNNNYPLNIKNSDLNKTNFTQNIFQFNNNNLYFLPQKDSNLKCENNFSNYQDYLNENNFNNPLNQFNFNVSQNNLFNYGKPYFIYNNSPKKNYTQKILDDYTIEMFGKRGWICENCYNFNYETRKRCNRCHIIKFAKKVKNEKNLFPKRKKIIKYKYDWRCIYCGNLNYSFRKVCNLCQSEKIYLDNYLL